MSRKFSILGRRGHGEKAPMHILCIEKVICACKEIIELKKQPIGHFRVPLFQNESKCKIMEMITSLICVKMNL